MEIPSLSSSSPAPPAKPAGAASRSRETGAGGSAPASAAATSLTLSAFEPIQRAMNNLPDSRAEVIARGKALAADPNYPPAAVIGKLARLFVADGDAALTAS